LHYGGVKRLETKTYGAELTHPSGWAELHLNGPSGGEIKLQKAGTTHLDIYASDAGSTSSVIKAQSHLRLSSNNSVAANRSIYLKSDGFVGIGNDAPSHKLHVTGDARIEGNLTINGTTTIVDTDVSTTEQLLITNDGTGPAIVANQTGTQPVVDFQDDGTSAFYIKNGGNVGIGTTSPAPTSGSRKTLHVKDTTNGVELRAEGNGSIVNIKALSEGFIGTQGSDKFHLQTNNTNQLL